MTLESPPAAVVLLRHLRTDAFNPAEFGGLPAQITDFAQKQRSMHQIARLADLIFRARAQNRDDVEAFCLRAIEAMGPKAEVISRALTEVGSGEQRAFLLTTAMLHGARLYELQVATGVLLRVLKHPRDDSPILNQSDWAERVKAIRASLDSDQRVTFDELDFDEAIRRYLSVYLPDVHRVLPDWFAEVCQQQNLGEEDRDSLTGHFAAQFLRAGLRSDRRVLTDLVAALTKSAGGSSERVAHQLLVKGLGSEEHGGHFREQILAWATGSSLPCGR